MRYVYPAFFTENEIGGYDVFLPDFDTMTQGVDLENAADMGADALWLMIDDYLQLDKPLPKPTYSTPDEGMLVAISIEIDTERGMLTTQMAAAMLDVSPARVRQMIGAGQLVAKKHGRDNYVYLWSVKERLANPHPAGRPKSKPATLSC